MVGDAGDRHAVLRGHGVAGDVVGKIRPDIAVGGFGRALVGAALGGQLPHSGRRLLRRSWGFIQPPPKLQHQQPEQQAGAEHQPKCFIRTQPLPLRFQLLRPRHQFGLLPRGGLLQQGIGGFGLALGGNPGIVPFALFGVGQHGVGLVYHLHDAQGFGVVGIEIGMIAFRQAAVGLAYLLIRSGFGHAQVAVVRGDGGHKGYLKTEASTGLNQLGC